jgi:hypothetical protein
VEPSAGEITELLIELSAKQARCLGGAAAGLFDLRQGVPHDPFDFDELRFKRPIENRSIKVSIAGSSPGRARSGDCYVHRGAAEIYRICFDVDLNVTFAGGKPGPPLVPGGVIAGRLANIPGDWSRLWFGLRGKGGDGRVDYGVVLFRLLAPATSGEQRQSKRGSNPSHHGSIPQLLIARNESKADVGVIEPGTIARPRASA